MKSPILALRQRKSELQKSMKAILNAADGRGGDVSVAEEQNVEKIRLALDDLEKKIIAEEHRLATECNAIGTPDENSAFSAMAWGEAPPADPRGPRHKAFGHVGVRSYAEMFGAPRGNSGFKSFEDFARTVRMSTSLGSFDPRLHASMTENLPSEGGWLLPDQLAAQVLDYSLENSVVLPRCQVWPMTSETLKVPGTQDNDHSTGALYGGITEFWANELQDIDEMDMQTRLVQLSANKLSMLSNASSELVEDGASFENLLTANLQAAAQFFLDKNFLFGSGAGRPKGMLDSSNPSLVVVTHNANTPTGGFIWEDAVAMYTAMAPACRGRAIWIFSNDLLPALSVMQIVVKNVAGSENVGGSATPQFKLNDDGTGTLLGRPAIFTEKLKTHGTQGDAAFVCPDQYAVGIRREMQLRRSLEAGFTNDSVWWRLTTRVDGSPLWNKKLTLSNGNVVSPFVTLSAR